MLVITTKPGSIIRIGTEQYLFHLDTDGRQVRLGFHVDKSAMSISRSVPLEEAALVEEIKRNMSRRYYGSFLDPVVIMEDSVRAKCGLPPTRSYHRG